MQSRLRAAILLSTFSAVPLLSGCPDPEGRFNEFVARVPDAKTTVVYDAPKVAEIPDITGTFVFAIHINILPNPVQALATVVMTPSGNEATANFHIQFLKVSDRTPTGTPFDVNGVHINSAAEFDLVVGTLFIPAAANPLGVDATAENVDLPGIITSKDSFCGSVNGHVTMPTPLDLAGSTFGAVRQTGATLPPPVSMCTAAPDAGM
jgi:hypothetical protein